MLWSNISVKIIGLTVLIMVTSGFTTHGKAKGGSNPPASKDSVRTQSSSKVAYWKFNEGEGTTALEQVSGREISIHNNFNDPAWKPGVEGTALRLDGYSTWLSRSLSQPLQPKTGLTIELWTAIKAYPVTNAPFANSYTFPDAGYFFGMTKLGRWYLAVSINGEWYTCWADSAFPKDRWVHVAGTFSQSEGLNVYLNGEKVGHKDTPNTYLTPEDEEPLTIGKDNHTPYNADVFPTGVLNGLVDELSVYNTPLTQQEIQSSYERFDPPAEPDFSVPDRRFANDPHRPRYHALPPAKWTNEPHGLVFEDGEYHMFYQHNPNGPYWSQIHWGHIKTTDLTNWQYMPIALAPGKSYDKVGIWSGDAVVNDGVPTAVYTGVDGVSAQVCLAMADSSFRGWKKYSGNPVIKAPPSGFKDFRDPYVWKDGDTWYLIIGTGEQNGNGAALLYKSSDLKNWTYLDPLKIGQNQGKTGTYWEMPVLAPLGNGKYIFIINTLPKPAVSYYWIGTWENEQFKAEKGPLRLDVINHLLSPTVTRDDKGRLVGIGIVPESRGARAQKEAGWSHTYSLPRVMQLAGDGTLKQTPAPELKKLRTNHIQYNTIQMHPDSSGYLPGVSGDQLEIKVRFYPKQAEEIGLTVRKSKDGEEFTRIYYDRLQQTFNVQREHSSLATNVDKSNQSGTFNLPEGTPLEMRVFIDHSVIEVFINNKEAFATRVYPTKESEQVDLYVSGGEATALSVNAWSLSDSRFTGIGFRDARFNSRQPNRARLYPNYPNPFNPKTRIRFTLNQTTMTRLTVYNLLGQKVTTLVNRRLRAGSHITTFNGDGLSSGVYTYRLKAGSYTQTRKMLLVK